MRKTPIFSFLIPATIAIAGTCIIGSTHARPLSHEDLFGTSPIPGLISIRPDEDPADSGLITIPPDIARHLRPDIGPDILRFHPLIPHIDEDPPLPHETPDASATPEASEEPVETPEASEDPTVIGPVDDDGNGSPVSGSDNAPQPTGSIPQVQIPANAGGCSLQVGTDSGFGILSAAAMALQALWFWVKRSK